MTTEKTNVPFLIRFGRTIVAPVDAAPIGYDNSRQEGLILEDGVWVPVLDAVSVVPPQTVVTEVKTETTDE